MQYRNFRFGHIEVEVDGLAYDLHNLYKFNSFIYDINNKAIALIFCKRKEEWVPPEEPSSIGINFKNVSYFSAEPRDNKMPFTEDDCIECIGYVEPNALTMDFSLLDDPTDQHHCVFRFQSGLVLRIQAEDANCDIKVA